MIYSELESPVGKLLLVSDGVCLTGLYMDREPLPQWQRKDEAEIFCATRKWLDSYFAGQPEPAADIPLKPEGTAFQKRVWDLLRTIPWGQTRSYGDLARQLAAELGKERMSAQAVGQAVGRNPVSILVPCHRVVGTDGSLTGYAGGLDRKKWLLCHEGWKGAKR